jgi:N-acetylneuraminic acid mutarotase
MIKLFNFIFLLLLLNGCKRQETEEPLKVAPQGSWHQKNIFVGEERYGAFGFSLNGKIYMGGGHVKPFIGSYDTAYLFNDFWEYDPTLDQWIQKADLPFTKVLDVAYFTINGKGYITTGVIGQTESYQLLYTNNLWEYDPATDQWTQKASFPGTARLRALSFSIANKGYVGLGAKSKDSKFEYDYLTDLWEYDPLADQWTQKQSLPAEGAYHTLGLSTSTYGYGYIGYYASTGSSENRKEWWRYNPSADSWQRMKDFQGPASFLPSGFIINDQVYFITGKIREYNDFVTPNLGSDFWVYDAGQDDWIVLQTSPRYNFPDKLALTINNKGYLMLGHSFSSRVLSASKEVHEYIPE